MRIFSYLGIFFCLMASCQPPEVEQPVLVGAVQMDRYLDLLKDKNIAFFGNHTSLIGTTHLVDTLTAQGIHIEVIFSPEHGFSGTKSDGEIIESENTSRDFRLISLYGKDKKPRPEDMIGIDLLVIDIQDVGVRFYTYASTITYLMEACADAQIPVVLLDRPNPNGNYIDGPVLDTAFSSFVGEHPIPLVHGLTLGELANMINGESWLETDQTCDLKVITCQNWTHEMPFALPVRPSPNLPNSQAICLYPSLALFEGTVVSVGRGTDFPFQAIGHPAYPNHHFSFTPQPNEGSKYPPLEGQVCYGLDLRNPSCDRSFSLKYLIDFYQAIGDSEETPFFNAYFERLVGTDQLRKQIQAGWSEKEIRQSWQEELVQFSKIRERYLLYP